MDIGFDHNAWTRTPAARALAELCGHAPEWTVLLARLDAGWSARRSLTANDGHVAPPGGSFHHPAALRLAGFENASRAVNPTALVNRKPDGGNAFCLAGDSRSGTRG